MQRHRRHVQATGYAASHRGRANRSYQARYAPKSSESVIVDATSGKGVPLTQAQWNVVFSVAGVAPKTVSHSWGMQDASGNIAATVGLLLTATGLEYQQVVTGWTRTGTRLTNNTTDSMRHALGAGSDPSTESVLWFCYADILASVAAARNIIYAGGAAAASECSLRSSATPVTAVKCMAATASGLADPSANGVRPYVLKYDLSGAGAVVGYTDQEKVTGTFDAGVTDGPKGFGNGAATSAGMDVLWGTMFKGTAAEWTDAEVKAVLQALNWTIPW